MSDITRGQAAPARRRAHLTVRVGAAGVLVLLVLSGAGAQGGDETQSAPVGADFSRHNIDARVPITEASKFTRLSEAPSSGCVLDPQYLPRTPDAVEGWYRSCQSAESRDRGCQFSPVHLPRTADAVEGWYRSCRTQRWS